MIQKDLVLATAAYDQFDSGVRDMWKNLTPHDKELVLCTVQELRQRGSYATVVAALLVWATTTMAKRDAEEKIDN